LKLTDDDILSIAATDLGAYAVLQWTDYDLVHHLNLIADHLEAVERGEISRLLITTPPRHGKTMLTSEFFPAWYLGRNPEKFIIFITYSQERANDVGRKVRNQLTDPLHQSIFLNCKISEDSAASNKFSTNQNGAYYAVGVGGPITGRGAHLLIIDDPIKGREDADSPTQRRKLIQWFQSVAYTRLMPSGSIIGIMTRWHEVDLAGWLLKGHENWATINLPALAEENDILGQRNDYLRLKKLLVIGNLMHFTSNGLHQLKVTCLKESGGDITNLGQLLQTAFCKAGTLDSNKMKTQATRSAKPGPQKMVIFIY
jgi:hypothetical protein